MEARFLSQSRMLADGSLCVGRMLVTQTVLGTGSAGTIVFEGSLDGRPIAVKRMLRQANPLCTSPALPACRSCVRLMDFCSTCWWPCLEQAPDGLYTSCSSCG